jgi:hypothetical protein
VRAVWRLRGVCGACDNESSVRFFGGDEMVYVRLVIMEHCLRVGWGRSLGHDGVAACVLFGDCVRWVGRAHEAYQHCCAFCLGAMGVA